MSVTTTFYTTDYFKSLLVDGDVSLPGDSFKIILLGVNGSNVSPTSLAPSVWRDKATYDGFLGPIVEFELTSSGTNYTTGGKLLADITMTEVAGTYALRQWDASDPTWASLNVSNTLLGVTGFAIYDYTHADKPIVCVGLFSTPAKFTTQNYTIKFSSSGIMRI